VKNYKTAISNPSVPFFDTSWVSEKKDKKTENSRKTNDKKNPSDFSLCHYLKL